MIIIKIMNEIAQLKNTVIKYMFYNQNKKYIQKNIIRVSYSTNLQAHAINDFLKLTDICMLGSC